MPYKGGALAVNDLLGGTLQGVLINIGAVTDHVKVGRMRGLFVSSGQRTDALPEVPTLAEAGHAAAPRRWAGTASSRRPAPIRRSWRGSTRRWPACCAKPDVAERVAALGLEPVDAPPEALGRVIQADAERWAEVVRRARIQPD